MSAVISISTGKAYGVSRVCRAWSPSRASGVPGPATGPDRGRAAPPPGTTRPPVGCRSGRGNQTGHHQQQVPWRGLSQGVGAPALQGHPHLESAGSAAHARERALCEAMSGAAHGPRAHDGTIIPGNIDERPRDVGHRHDRHPPEHRASGRGPCRGRSLFGGLRGHSCSHPGHTLRGVAADPPGRAGLLRGVADRLGQFGLAREPGQLGL